MHVFLTIDVECYSGDYEAEVYGDGLGLPFILDACRRHQHRATFFVEALGATKWGDVGVRRICRDLKEQQQDIQLHIHPSVAKVEGLIDCLDRFCVLDEEMQEHLLRVGGTILKSCGVSAISAFRAGDLAANDVTLLAMGRAGITIGSNRDLDGKCSIRSKLNHFFPVVNDISIREGQMDLPITVMRSPFSFMDGAVRHFEVSALGTAEMMNGLRQLKRAGYATATILTHPGEFFRKVNGRYVPVQKNCRRWEALLKFLSQEPCMTVSCVSECEKIMPFRDKIVVPGVPSGTVKSGPRIPMFNPLYSLVRMAQQSRHRLWAWQAGVRP